MFLIQCLRGMILSSIFKCNKDKDKEGKQARCGRRNEDKIMIYLSGIPQFRSREVRVMTRFDSNSVSIDIPLGSSVRILKEDLLSVQEKTESQISKDVTLTRLLAFGIFAFGLKKKRKTTDKYLILSYMDSGQQVTAIFKNHSSSIFKKLFNAVKEGQEIRDNRQIPITSERDSILDQLTKLNELRKEKAITEEEYNKLKAIILGN